MNPTKSMHPITGQQYKNDGSIVNVAEVLERAGSVNVWPFGETLTGSKRDDISIQYQYPFVNTSFDFRAPVTTGDGAVVQADSLLQLSATTGTAEVESIDATSYRPGHSGFIDFTASFTGSGKAIIGGKGAFQIRYDNGALSFGYVKGGEFVGVPVDTTGLHLDKLNIWRIIYGYLGVANPVLMVKRGIYRTVATVQTEGEIDSTHVDDPNFPAFHRVEGACVLKSGSFAAGVIDDGESVGFRSFVFPNTPISDGAGVDQGDVTLVGSVVSTLAVFRNKLEYQARTNTVRAFLSLWTVYVESPATGAGDVVFQVITNPTLSGTPTYASIDADSSVIEVDHTAGTGASVTYASGGRVILQTQLPYAAGQGNRPGAASFTATEASQLGASLAAGDTLVIVAKDKDGNGVVVRSSIGWRERF